MKQTAGEVGVVGFNANILDDDDIFGVPSDEPVPLANVDIDDEVGDGDGGAGGDEGGGDGKNGDSVGEGKNGDDGDGLEIGEGGDGGDEGGGAEGGSDVAASDDEDAIDYGALLKALHQRGIIDDPSDVKFEDEDGNEVKLDEENVIDAIEDLIKAKDESKYESLSEFTRALIEVERMGGNVDTLIQYYRTVQMPAKDIDITKEQGQMDLLKHFYKVQGKDAEEAIALIEYYKDKGVLSDKAQLAKDKLDEDERKRIETAKQEQATHEQKQKEFVAAYKKALNKNLERFQLNESARKRLVEASVSRNKDGQWEMQQRFAELWNNPETAAELVFYLTDRDGFMKYAGSAQSRDKMKEVMRRVIITNKNRAGAKETEKRRDKGEDLELG
jgi:hypothetical protein